MSLFQYPLQRFTSNIGLALYGMDEILAENMLLIDAAYGSGSSIFVNGTLVTSPNLSSTLPAAPPGNQLVTFQFDSNGNISAYIPTAVAGGVTSLSGDGVVYNNALSVGAVTLSLISQTANTVFAGPTLGGAATPTFRALVAADLPAGTSAWASLTGTLSNGQVIPYADSGISRLAASYLAIGNGTNGDYSGSLFVSKILEGMVGTTSPSSNAALEIHRAGPYNDGSGNYNGNTISVYTHLDSSSTGGFGNYYGPAFNFNRSGGTQAAPTALVHSAGGANILGYTNWNGYDGTSYATGFNFTVQATTDWNATHHSTWMYINAVHAGDNGASPVFAFNANPDNGGDTACNSSSLPFGLGLTGPYGGRIFWGNSDHGYDGTAVASISCLGATSTLAIGNGADGDFSGTLKTAIVNAVTGFQINGAATLGHVLRGNGTNFVDAALAIGDLTNIAGGTVLGNTGTTAGAVAATIAPVLGIPGTSTGSIALASSTASGKYTITAPANAATPTLTLPTGSGTFCVSASSPLTLNATTGNMTFSGSGAVTWDQIGNAAADLTLANAGFKTTFNQTSAVAWLWANTTAGTTVSVNNPPSLNFGWNGNGTTGLISLGVVTTANNGSAVLAISATGGAATAFQLSIPQGGGSVTQPQYTFTGATGYGLCLRAGVALDICINGADVADIQATTWAFGANKTVGWSSSNTPHSAGMDSGISRLGANSLAIGNGTAGNTTGNLSLNRINLAGADYAGQATITAASTTQAVTFAANYTGTAQPVIVITPTSDPLALGVPVGYWVTYSGGAGAWTGFVVNIQTALAGNVTFNYIVIGRA